MRVVIDMQRLIEKAMIYFSDPFHVDPRAHGHKCFVTFECTLSLVGFSLCFWFVKTFYFPVSITNLGSYTFRCCEISQGPASHFKRCHLEYKDYIESLMVKENRTIKIWFYYVRCAYWWPGTEKFRVEVFANSVLDMFKYLICTKLVSGACMFN